jgi:hypothetical protein
LFNQEQFAEGEQESLLSAGVGAVSGVNQAGANFVNNATTTLSGEANAISADQIQQGNIVNNALSSTGQNISNLYAKAYQSSLFGGGGLGSTAATNSTSALEDPDFFSPTEAAAAPISTGAVDYSAFAAPTL